MRYVRRVLTSALRRLLLALNIAKAFLKQGKKAMGVAKLKEVVKTYPKTAAAKQADDLLLDLEIEQESP